MTQALAFGTYIPGTSPIHALKALDQDYLGPAFFPAVFFVESWPGLLVITAFVCHALHALRAFP